MVAGTILLAFGFALPAAGSIGAGAALATAWLRRHPGRAWHRPTHPITPACTIGPVPRQSDLYLDLAEVEVEAVYLLGAELFTSLRGGNGKRIDPVTGNQRHIETSDVSVIWHCHGRRMATRQAGKLNEWQAKKTPLRLFAARGSAALLVESDMSWIALPEVKPMQNPTPA